MSFLFLQNSVPNAVGAAWQPLLSQAQEAWWNVELG